ncbi:hypothetical protein IL306_001105 [Fusarium sp. DS 682]|nr:hypothetical protein IL306_001105 [Fusarium sp. DS 682]
MPICIECRHPVKTLWTAYSGAGDKASGHNIRLTVCRNCGRFCDKYVEHDFVPSIIRLGTLLLLFDVYLTWARLEKQTVPDAIPGASNLGKLAQQPIVLQYLFFPRSLGWAVVANNVEALRILLDCNYLIACLLAIAGAASRWVVGRAVLLAAGLADVDSIGESGVAADGKALWALLMYAKEWAGRLAVG